jgi:carbonic anhydrase
VALVDELMQANGRYAAAYVGPAGKRPARALCVIACMDTRLELLPALGLATGEAHVLRNGGGLITEDVLRSLAISQRHLGTTAVLVVHHTDCGMLGFDDAAFRAELAAETGRTPSWDVPGFTDIEGQVHRSVESLRACAWLPHRDQVSGAVYHVETGRITPIGTAAP